MPGTDPLLIPTPRHVRQGEGTCDVPAWLTADRLATLLADLGAILGPASVQTRSSDWASALHATLSPQWCGSSPLESQGYTLTISKKLPISISAPTHAGVRHALATLAQLLRQFPGRLPCLTITDSPSISTRGVMLDVSRDRIPTMATFRTIIDDLAGLKVNHLQLYTEHTFAYAGHETVWKGWSPLTPGEMRELDAYAHARGIELAANQNCFGHLRHWLRHPEYAHLAETHGDWMFDAWKRSGPFSLCPTDPASLILVRDLLEQLTSCVRSPLVNVGCDETYDVGFGRSRAEVERRGRGAVCLDFLRGVNDIAQGLGKKAMYWADGPLAHPELLPHVPSDMIALAWGYEPLSPFDGWAKSLCALPQGPGAVWLCPGTSSWRSLAGRTAERWGNIVAAARAALAHGVGGMLVCDWGDTGHWQQWPVSMLGIAHGAHAAWNVQASATYDPRAISLHALHDPTMRAAGWLEELGDADLPLRETCLGLAKVGQTGRLLNQSAAFIDLFKTHDELLGIGELDAWTAAHARAQEAIASRPDTGNAVLDAELSHTARFVEFATRRASVRRTPGKHAPAHQSLRSDLQRLRDEHGRLWHTTSRPGGLDDSLAHFDTVAGLL